MFLGIPGILAVVCTVVFIYSHTWDPKREEILATFLSILPNVLGFSIGAYAMLLGFTGNLFKKAIMSESGNGDSTPYTHVSGSFAMYLIIQVTALLVVTMSESLLKVVIRPDYDWFRETMLWTSTFTFFYSLTILLNVILDIHTLSVWYQDAFIVEEEVAETQMIEQSKGQVYERQTSKSEPQGVRTKEVDSR